MLLVERGYDKVSMREIASVAGVGLGTLYQYFPGKDSIAAVAVRSRLRRLAAKLEAAAAGSVGLTLQHTIRALVAAHVRTLLEQSAEWRALLYLERRISSPASYREIYREYVAVFCGAFAAASDWPAAQDARRAAFNAFSIVDALSKQALLVQDACPGTDELAGDVEDAVSGYLRSVLPMTVTTGAAARAGAD